MGEIIVSDKGGEQNLQVTEAFPSSNKMMMTRMVHLNHHYRPLSSSSIFDNDPTSGDYGDGNGPTSCMPITYGNHIYQVVAGSPGAHYTINASYSASECVEPLKHLDTFPSTSTPTSSTPARATTAFKSPAAGMAASLGFPFTNAQWKELQRQAMIYKYMVASVPVPPDLLIPLTRGTPVSDNSHFPLDSRFNLRLSSGGDLEPGRCRRTDGKKWRCSRDVAPNHKYCERHMHRGRPRSRKPVEVHGNNTNNSSHHIKKSRHDYNAFSSSSPATVAISNPTISKNSSSSSFLSPPANHEYPQPPVSLDKFSSKAANCDSLASVSSDKEPRGLDWMRKDSAVSLATSELWQPLIQTKIGLSTENSCQHSFSLSNPNYEDSMFLNSYAIFSSGEQQNRDCSLFFNPDILPMGNNPQPENCRGFIDAWSDAESDKNNPQRSNEVVSPNGTLSLSSLNLSMGSNGAAMYEDMGNIHMGLGLMETNGGNTYHGTKSHLSSWLTPPWVSSTPGGPLAEVLRPSTVPATKDAATNPSSPVVTNSESGSPMATVDSSPSAALQKTVNSLSDSSTASSPTNATSRANSEMAVLWMSRPSKLVSST